MVTYRRKARNKIVEKIKNSSEDKVCIFKNRKELNKWLENIEITIKN